MAFTEYPVIDGQRVADIKQATHEVRCKVRSLHELLDQIDEEIETLNFAKKLAKEEVKKSLKIVLS